MSDKCVQGTNDSSIVSKASAAEKGYFDDPFLAHVVLKKVRRAPLINRGYYIRMKAVDAALRHFISVTSGAKSTRYIISLGAGFDTAYFRLKSKGLLTGVVFIEVDFYDVALNKARLIQQSTVLSSTIGPFELKVDSNILLRSPDYCLLASDLTHEAVLDACFRELIPDWDAPTFFLSECVLTYVTPKNTAALINWISQEFACCVFFLYEQIKPYDSFGVIMCQHFKSLGSPLKCIETYSQLSDQKRRFSIGWQVTEALDMNAFYLNSLDQSERARVEHLEVFDEYEEWSAKCSHYFVLAAQSAAYHHGYSEAGRFFQAAAASAEADGAPAASAASGNWRLEYGLGTRALGPLARVRARPLPSDCRYPFRLHWAALCPVSPSSGGGRPPQLLLRVGGYGRDPLAAPGHRRLACLTLLDPFHRAEPCHLAPEDDDNDCRLDEAAAAAEQQGGWQDHLLGPLACCVGPAELLLFGGKASPLRASARLLRLRLTAAPDGGGGGGAAAAANVSAKFSEVKQLGPAPPCARWRHAGCCAPAPPPITAGSRVLVVYGGRTPDHLCLADAHLCLVSPGVSSVIWEALPPALSSPGPRCSAAMCAHPSRPLCYLSGGLTTTSYASDADHRSTDDDDDLRPASDLWQLDLTARQWTRLRLEPRLPGGPAAARLPAPRFGHALHCVSSSASSSVGGDGDACWLVCFGGVAITTSTTSAGNSSDQQLVEDEESPCLTVLRVGGASAASVGFVNLGVDFEESQSPNFLAFNSASAIVSTSAEDQQQQLHESPLLVAVGGGGSCFSFGTHLNSAAICLPLSEILLPVASLFVCS